MDNPGWHAQRRAQKESQAYQAAHGQYPPVEQLGPMDEKFIGGFHAHHLRHAPPSPRPPPVPPKDTKDASYFQQEFPIAAMPEPFQQTISTAQLTHMSAVERSQTLRVARMEPHLQFMCGPLLRYDTVDEQGTWHGAALVVTADSGSIYEPHPTLTYEWDPDMPQMRAHSTHGKVSSFELGPHPADPNSTLMAASPISGGFSFPPNGSPSSSRWSEKNGLLNGNGNGNGNGNASVDGHTFSVNARQEEAMGQEIWVYGGHNSTFTFWRFFIHIPLAEHEMSVRYSVNKGQVLEFCVPGRSQNFRWAAHSCNGFSAGVNQDDFRGPGFQNGYDPLWMDLLARHSETPFHVLVGGGDQLYCDSLMREPEMQDWVSRTRPEEKKSYPLSDEMSLAIDRFFFNHYCQHFRSGAFARANSSIPMMNMCDDHDLIDGFGSYPDDLQLAPVFRAIGSRGYFFYLLFQCFVNPELDGISDLPGKHSYRSMVIGNVGPYVPYPSHSILSYLGPQSALLMLDCRAERKKDQVCSSGEYDKVFKRLKALPQNVEHLVVQIGIPIAYPRMVFLESALESKYNPLVALGKSGSLGLSGFVNKFNAQAELLDDLNDHWTARSHKKERNWFIQELQKLALEKRMRITFVSGDVHCAAVGVLKTLKRKHVDQLQPVADHRYMLNVVTSAIVNTPPPNGVIALVSTLASKVHKTLHGIETDETMLPVFTTETNGQPRKQKFVMGKRNWCRVDWDPHTRDLVFDLRVEKQKGYGVTVGYPVRAPPPGWAPELPRRP